MMHCLQTADTAANQNNGQSSTNFLPNNLDQCLWKSLTICRCNVRDWLQSGVFQRIVGRCATQLYPEEHTCLSGKSVCPQLLAGCQLTHGWTNDSDFFLAGISREYLAIPLLPISICKSILTNFVHPDGKRKSSQAIPATLCLWMCKSVRWCFTPFDKFMAEHI